MLTADRPAPVEPEAPEAPREPEPSRARGWSRLRYLVGAAVAVVLVLVVLPALTGVGWAQLATTAAQVSPVWLVALVVLWIVGLLAHTITLTAALPGLTHRRALTLSLTGSAVANVLPLGGAAGIALNHRMVRTWGHDGTSFGTYTVVSNVWDVLAKLVIPLVALPSLLVAATSLGATAVHAAVALVVVLAVMAALVAVTLGSRRTADRTGALADRLLGRWLRGRSCRQALVDLQAATRQVVRTGWPRLSLGMALYSLLLFALLAGCLTATGAGLSLGAVAAGFAVERLLTLAGLTPGGAGVVEVGLTSALLAFSGAPAGVALGVLLYRTITFGLEIPVGGVTLACWLWQRRRVERMAVA